MNHILPLALILALLAALCPAPAAEQPEATPQVSDLSVRGAIVGENITFTLDLMVETFRAKQELALVAGDLVLDQVLKGDGKLRYDPTAGTYLLAYAEAGRHPLSVSFAARPKLIDNGPWRESSFSIPSSAIRTLKVECDRADLEVRFPGALRVERAVDGEKLAITAILGPGKPFAVAWKPEIGQLDAKLVLSTTANTIATASAGALRLDSLYLVEIAQGKLDELTFAVPKGLSLTQVRGEHIRDWRLSEDGEQRTLIVTLNRPQTTQYALAISSEMVLPTFPTELRLPVIEPLGAIRAAGHIALGTDSAIHLQVKQAGGLAQIDGAAFPLIVLDSEHPRPLPKHQSFFYSHAAGGYVLALALDDIVPSFDVAEQLVLTVKEEDLLVDAQIEVDVRDAPIRQLVLAVPSQLVVAAVSGSEVEEDAFTTHTTSGAAGTAAGEEVTVNFKRPVLGRNLVKLRLELGRSPLDKRAAFTALAARGAKSCRGYLVVVADKGLQVETSGPTDDASLRQVHTGAVPMKIADAQVAYRFRDTEWTLSVLAGKKQAGVRAEAFHLVSLGEGVLYGSEVVNYVVTGAPVDEFHFHIPASLQNVEFVGTDVSQKTHDGEHWTVKLRRKVVGDYNLGISYSQRYADGGAIVAGGIECARVETQTGYITIASQLNLSLAQQGDQPANLLEISRDEIPANYRLLVNAPVLRTYKYVATPHQVGLTVGAYARGTVLPVIIEVAHIRSQVSVRGGGQAESLTTVRYKIKNATEQFLSLTMPAGAKVWSTHLIEDDGSGKGEQRTPITASHDGAELKIPLKRYPNPNQPTTIELEYGQPHTDLGWRGGLVLQAPLSKDVRSTYANWQVAVPEGWAISAGAGGTMVAETGADTARGLGDALALAGSGWAWSIANSVFTPAFLIEAAAVAAALVIVFLLRRSLLPGVALTLVVGLALWLGVRAGLAATQWLHLGQAVEQTPMLQAVLAQSASNALEFSQTLNLDGDQAATISAAVVPAWREHLSIAGALVAPLFALLCALTAWKSVRMRRLAGVAAVAALCFAAGQIPAATVPLVHLFTWGLPALVAAWCLWRLVRRLLAVSPRPLPAKAATAAAVVGAAIIAMVMFSGCTDSVARDPLAPLAAGLVLDRAEADLSAEKDSMAVELRLKFHADGALRFPVLDDGAILMSGQQPAEHVRLVEQKGQQYVQVDRAGDYAVTLKFLTPLAEAGEDQCRSFRMPLSPALTNRVVLTVPVAGMEIDSPTAVRLERVDDDSKSVARAIIGPHDWMSFSWHPRARRTALEKTLFFTETASLIRFDVGTVEARHRIHFQIAQGELRDLALALPENVTVTGVEGVGLGTWRFDPATHRLEARLSQPASGEYALTVVAQVTARGLPWDLALGGIAVDGAANQRAILALATSPAVFLLVHEHPQAMNADDFLRDAKALLASAAGFDPAAIRAAYRFTSASDPLTMTVGEVKPELRVKENASFSVSDDRLVYNGELAIEIAKAGVFAATLVLPEGYDIDALAADEVSHWDDAGGSGGRAIVVHFRRKLMGTVTLKLALSRPVSDLPERIEAPRIAVAEALKHTGQVVVSAERGVRLVVKERKGVSEVEPAELGIKNADALAFKLLRPDWSLALSSEVVRPLVNVDYLHVARVTEGLVRHTQYLRFKLQNSGAKLFEVVIPKDALGLSVNGPAIATWKDAEREGQRVLKVELARKWFDRPYPLTITYETRFDRATGKVELLPVKALGADLQRGHLAVYATERVELGAALPDKSLQVAEARSIARDFGASDLADAAFCYSSAAADYLLTVTAKRHDAAAVLEAQVRETVIDTVVTERGETINRVHMSLVVGSKRHLEVTLPAGAQVWTLMVNRRSTVPSRKATPAGGGETILIPLAQASIGELPVDLDFIYVLGGHGALGGGQQLSGPRFDLPLKAVTWNCYLPEAYDYRDFAGTLTVDEQYVHNQSLTRYDLNAYEATIRAADVNDRLKAVELQTQGKQLAQSGKQYEARQALELAGNYSVSDQALNEDARVQLHQLNKQQALVSIVGRRGYLRANGAGGSTPAPAQGAQQDLGDSFNAQDAARVESSLSKDDSDNLNCITARLIETQEAAAGPVTQLAINVPLRGRKLAFIRPLQVNPDTEMTVAFTATAKPKPGRSWWPAVAVAAALFVGLSSLKFVSGTWSAMAARFAAPTEEIQATTTVAGDPWAGLEAPAPTVAAKGEPMGEKPAEAQSRTEQPRAADEKKLEGGPEDQG